MIKMTSTGYDIEEFNQDLLQLAQDIVVEVTPIMLDSAPEDEDEYTMKLEFDEVFTKVENVLVGREDLQPEALAEDTYRLIVLATNLDSNPVYFDYLDRVESLILNGNRYLNLAISIVPSNTSGADNVEYVESGITMLTPPYMRSVPVTLSRSPEDSMSVLNYEDESLYIVDGQTFYMCMNLRTDVHYYDAEEYNKYCEISVETQVTPDVFGKGCLRCPFCRNLMDTKLYRAVVSTP
jgi:hypothetical protein